MSSHEPIDTATALQTARQSLQNRDFDTALTTLQQAAAQDPSSPELYELLGVAYTQKGMVSEGLQALTSAVTLNTSNVTSRINLAVALQRAGHLPEAAVQLQEALKIDPANEKARQSLQGLQAQMGQTTQSVPPYSQPTVYNQPAAGYGSSQPPPINQASDPGPYGQSSPYAAAGSGFPPQEAPQGYPPSQGYPPPTGGGAYNPYGQTAYGQPPYGGYYGTVPDDPNGWSPTNIGPILTAPVEFFQRQRGQKGLGLPLGYALILLLLGQIFTFVLSLAHPATVTIFNQTTSTQIHPGMALFSFVVGVIGIFVLAGVMNLSCMIFGIRGGFPGTYRAVIYSYTPISIFGILYSLIANLTGSWQLGLILLLAGMIWSFVLLVIGLREIHGLESGSAVGAVVVGFIGAFVLYIIFAFIIGVIFLGLFSASGGMRGTIGGPSGFPR